MASDGFTVGHFLETEGQSKRTQKANKDRACKLQFQRDMVIVTVSYGSHGIDGKLTVHTVDIDVWSKETAMGAICGDGDAVASESGSARMGIESVYVSELVPVSRLILDPCPEVGVYPVYALMTWIETIYPGPSLTTLISWNLGLLLISGTFSISPTVCSCPYPCSPFWTLVSMTRFQSIHLRPFLHSACLGRQHPAL